MKSKKVNNKQKITTMQNKRLAYAQSKAQLEALLLGSSQSNGMTRLYMGYLTKDSK